MAGRHREPTRMENIQAAARRRISGDPRLGSGGTADRPWHVVIDDAADKFFHSFQAPTSNQGPQRPGEQGGHTGEAMFRTMLADQQVAAQVARETATQLKTAASMAAQFSGELGRFTSAMKAQQEVERQRISDVLDRIERTFGGGTTAGPSAAPGGAGTRAGTPRPTTGGSTRPAGPGRPAKPNMDHSQLSTHQAHARRLSHGGLRRQMLGQVGEAYHQTYGQGTDQSPTVVAMRDDSGQVTHYEERDGAGQLLSTTSVNDPLAPSMARRAMHALTVSRIAGAVAAGQGAGGMLRAGAGGIASSLAGSGSIAGGVGAAARLGARAVPFVGAAMMVGDAAMGGFRWEQEQRAKNSFYQSVQGYDGASYGGIPGMATGFGSRLQEEGFTWAETFRGGLQDDQARQLFKGASALGLQGGARDRALAFGSQNYRSMGMSVDQSLKAIGIASQTANVGLAGLSKSLTEVTKSARNTGQSADYMRDRFLGVFQAASAAGFSTAAPEMASILTQVGPGRSRNTQDVNYSGMFEVDQQRLLAAQMGVSPGQLSGMNASGNILPGLEGKDKQIQGAIDRVLTPQAKAALQQKIAAAGGPEAVQKDPKIRQRIGNELLREGYIRDANIISGFVNTMTGVDPGQNPDSIMEWLVDQKSGGGGLAPRERAEQATKNQRALTDEDKQGLFGTGFGGGGHSKFVYENQASQLSKLDVFDWFTGEQKTRDQSVQAYAERQGKTNQTDPAIEAMITQYGGQSDVGVEVNTKAGPKVVSQADAIKYYADQLASGDATLVGGTESGKKLGAATNTVEKNYQGPKSTEADPQGETFSQDEWKKAHPGQDMGNADAGQGGKVTIELTDEAKRLFKIGTVSGNVTNGQVESGAGAGVPPALPPGPR